MFTAQIMKKLQGSVLAIDDGVVYLYDTGLNWGLAFVDKTVFHPLVVSLLESRPQSRVDAGILAASGIDLESQTFLPALGRCSEPVYLPISWAMTYDGGDAKRKIEAACIAASNSSVDLSEMVLRGAARPIYRKEAGGIPGASLYVLRYGTRVQALDPKLVEAFHALGLTLHGPVQMYRPSQRRPPVAIQNATGSVFGFVDSERCSGIRKDDLDRDVFGDITDIAWIDEGLALEALRTRGAHPLSMLPGHWTELSNTYFQFMAELGALRWHGWDDESIQRAYMEARPFAMKKHYDAIDERCRAALAEVRSGRTYRMRTAQDTAQEALKGVSVIQQVMGAPIPMDSLNALIQELNTVGV